MVKRNRINGWKGMISVVMGMMVIFIMVLSGWKDRDV